VPSGGLATTQKGVYVLVKTDPLFVVIDCAARPEFMG